MSKKSSWAQIGHKKVSQMIYNKYRNTHNLPSIGININCPQQIEFEYKLNQKGKSLPFFER
jgi:hypothetical protein